MLPLSPDGEPQRLAATVYTPQNDVYERSKALELQLTLEYQRQRIRSKRNCTSSASSSWP